MTKPRAPLARALLLVALACGTGPKDSGGTPGEPRGGLVPVPTPRGAPVSRTIATTIPPAGGSLATSDGALTVAVPAGAVSAATELTVTPIANTARGAIGGAFRLGPEGSTFSAPVTLTFKAPEKYPTGTSIAGVGVEYQDKRGYWHKVEPVTRNAGAKTVSVTTDHFSDWALTWQTGTAAAEGPIRLVQSVDVPFDAFGRATVYYQGETATETTYLLTGTLTVPETITVRDEVCVPDQRTKTLPLNVADLTKGQPAVFRWGINATWSLSCTAPGGAVTTRLMPTLFDTMYINLTRCGGYYEAGQIATPERMSGTYTKNCGFEGLVSATWDLRACVEGQPCEPGGVCRAGATVCTNGIASCVDVGPAANGTVCGPTDNLVCSEAQCVDLLDQEVGFTLTPVAGLTTTESGGTATFEIVLNKAPTIAVTVALSTDSPEGSVAPASVTFTPADWNVPQVVTVKGNDDFVDDGDVAYHVVTAPATSVDPRYGGRDPDDAQVTNVDDDVAGIVLGPSSGLVTTESGGTATFQVALSSQPVADVTIDLSSGDTTEGTVGPATVTFTDATWNVPQTVTVTGVDDAVDDGAVAYEIGLVATSADPKYGGRTAGMTVTNDDNDTAGLTVSPAAGLATSEAGGTATFTVALQSEPVADVTVPVVSTNAAEGLPSVAQLVFTPADWSVAQTVTVTGVQDSVADGPIVYGVTVGPPSTLDTVYVTVPATSVEVTNGDDDFAGITVEPPTGIATSEGGTSVSFAVVLTSQPTADVSIPLSSGDSTEASVSAAALTFTVETWNVPQTVTVTGVDDRVADGDQLFDVLIGPSTSDDPKYAGIDPTDVRLANADDDVAGLAISPISGLVTTEAGGTATFTVALTSEPTADVSVAVSSGDATEGTVSPATITFTAGDWEVPQVVTVTGRDDAVADGTIAYSLAVAATSGDLGYQGLTGTVSATNEDDDVVGLVVSAAGGLVTTEAGGTASFTVVLQSEPTAEVRISIGSTDAGEGIPSTAELVFTGGDWDVAQTVTVRGADDFVADGPAAYAITVGPPSSADAAYAALAAASVAITNADDDVAGVAVGPPSGIATSEAGTNVTFPVVLTSEPTADVSIPLSSGDATEGTVSPASLTFTAVNWNQPQTVTVTGVDDRVDDGDQLFAVLVGVASSADPSYSGFDPADVQLTNADDDAAGFAMVPAAGVATSEPAGAATFQLSLSTEPVADVTVSLSSSDASEGTVSPASVTFTPTTWNVPQIVTVTGADDALADGAISYAIVLSGSSADANYAARSASLPATNADDDVAGIVVSAPSGASTTEAGTSVTFTVVLRSQPTADVTLPVASGDASEASVSPAALTFTAETWSVPQTVTVTGADDHVADGDQPFAVVLGPSASSDASYAAVRPADVQLTNVDDDVAGLVVSSASGLATTEAGGTATFELSLSSEPTADVTVAITSGDATEGTGSPASVTFTASNWNVPQAVTARGADDFVVDGAVEYAILLAATSADGGYEGRTSSVPVTNADDDVAGLALSPGTLATTEAGGTATFQVALTSQPTADVTVTLTTSDPTEGTVAPATLTFTATTWNVGQPVTVRGVDDAVADGAVAYTVELAAASADAGYGERRASAPVTNSDDDAVGISVASPTGTATTEAGGAVTFTVALASQPVADVSIPLSSSDAGEAIVSPASLLFTVGDWSVPRTVTVTGVQDLVADGDQPVIIVLGAASSTDPAYAALDAPDVALTNRDDDAPGFVLSPASGLGTTEAGGAATFEVSLSSQPIADVTVTFTSSDAGEGVASPASVVFTSGDWNVPRPITVTGADDAVADGSISYAILLTAASADAGYGGRTASVAATNADDDVAGVSVAPASGASTSEPAASTTLTVVLTSEPTADVSVALSTSDATEGTVSPALLVFTPANWNLAQAVTVTGVDDAVVDGPVAYAIELATTSADGAYQDRTASASVTNADDDVAGIVVSPPAVPSTSEGGASVTFTVALRSEPTAEVSIPLSSSDTTEGTVAPASLVFTPVNWNVAQAVTVTGVDDAVDDGDRPFTIAIGASESADPSYVALDPADLAFTNANDDSAAIVVSAVSGGTTERGGAATFQVSLASQPTADVTVALSSSDEGEGTVAPASLTFTAVTWNAAQTVTVTGVDDAVADGAIGYAIQLTAASADGGYDGRVASAPVTNADDDLAGVAVSPPSGVATSERGTSVTFTVVLASQPTADVTIPLSSSDGGEGSVAPASLTFTTDSWNAPQTVTVTGVDDRVDDGDQPFRVVVGPSASADPGYVALGGEDVVLANVDDDAAGFAVSPAALLSTTEAGGTATFELALASEPTADVTVTLASGDATEGSVSPASLVFTAGDWSVPRAVTVTGVDDDVVDGAVAYAILLTGASAEPGYQGLTGSVPVANADDDVAEISLALPAGTTTSEAGGSVAFTVVLRSQPASDVTIPLSSGDLTEGAVSPATLVFTAESWNVAQTVTVSGVDDPDDDGDQAFTVVVGPSSSADPHYQGLDPTDPAFTNADDDVPGLALTPAAGATTEAGGAAIFQLALTSRPTADVTVALSSSDGTEGAVSPASVVFTSVTWNVARTVTVTGVDDVVVDGPVVYALELAATSGDPGYEGRTASATVTNADDDQAALTVSPPTAPSTSEAGSSVTFTVVLRSQPAADVSVPLSSSDTTEATVAPADLVFTPSSWNVPQVVTATGVGDLVDDGDQPFTIVIGPATSADALYEGVDPADLRLTNLDDDAAGLVASPASGATTEAGGAATFQLALASQPTADVTVTLSSGDPTEGTVAPASLVFTAQDWSVAQVVTVTGLDDAVADGAVGYAIQLAASSADGVYEGRTGSVPVTNVDDDVAGISVSAPSGTTVTEAAGSGVTFSIALTSQPTADVSVVLTSTDTTAGVVSPRLLTFGAGNWNVAQVATVRGRDDFLDDGDQPFTVLVGPATSADAAYAGLGATGPSFLTVDDDEAGFAASAISGPTTEGGGTATFQLALSSQPTADVTVSLSSSDLTEGTVAPASVLFTAGNWNVAQTVTVTGANDDVADGAVAYVIQLDAASADPGYASRLGSVPVTNADDDVAGISVSAPSATTTSEAGASATFTVVLRSQPTADVSVPVSSSDDTEGAAAPAALVFTPGTWNLAQTVTVTGVGDALDDGDQPFTIVVGPSTSADGRYVGLPNAELRFTNSDDDAAGLAISPASGATTEAGGTATFQLALTSQPTADVTVTVSSSDPTEGTVSPASVVFTSGDWNVARQVTVTGVDDGVADGAVAYEIQLAASSADGGYQGRTGSAAVTNADDDVAGIAVSPPSGVFTSERGTTVTFTVVLESEPTADVSIPLETSLPGEAVVSPAVLVFTADDWSLARTVTVTGVDDFVDDGDQPFLVAIGPSASSDPSYAALDVAGLVLTNTDDDTAGLVATAASGDTTEGGGTATFQLALASRPTADVTVALSSSDSTEGSASPASVVFTSADWNAARTVTVTGANDFDVDGPVAYVIELAATSADGGYAGATGSVAVTNLDDDVAGISVVSPAETTTSEAGGTVTFDVVLTSKPGAEVRVPLSSSDATEGAVSPTSLVFTPDDWNVVRTVTVSGVDDPADDGDQTFTVAIGPSESADAAYHGRDPSDLSLTNVDDDVAGITVSAPTAATTSEAGGFVTFTVALTSQPAADVSIPLSSDDASEGAVSPATLVFTPANWSVPRTVTVWGVNDSADDGDQPFTVLVGPSTSADPSYGGVNPSDLAFTNADDDAAGLVLTAASGPTTEAGGTATFELSLAWQPTADVTVTLSSDDPSEGAVSPASVVFTSVDWSSPRVVTVTGADDAVADGAVTYAVTLAATSVDPSYEGLTSSTPVTNADDDVAAIAVGPPSGFSTTEAGGAVTFTVVLQSQPTADVSLRVSSSDTTEAVVSADLLTFTPESWSTPQTVIVTGVDDPDDDGDIPFAVSIGPSESADPSYAGLTFEDLVLSNTDDDPVVIPTGAPQLAAARGAAD